MKVISNLFFKKKWFLNRDGFSRTKNFGQFAILRSWLTFEIEKMALGTLF